MKDIVPIVMTACTDFTVRNSQCALIVKRPKDAAPVRRRTAGHVVATITQICARTLHVPHMYAMGVSASTTVENPTSSTVQM